MKHSPLLLITSTLASFLLAGCSASFAPSTDVSSLVTPLGVIRGSLHGGQQAIAGAHIYLFSAGSTGYGGNGLAPASSNASISLLKDVAGATTIDSNLSYYVTSAADGSFSITGDYTCNSGDEVYLYGAGGDAGAGPNSAVGLMAVLGPCPTSGTFSSTIPYLNVNEVTTVAAAYAMAGFATDATHVSSSGSSLAKIGMANAFANAANLAQLSSGSALALTPAGNGLVPQAMINTLANILAACINSTGSTSTTCGTLFANAQSAGSTGGKPTDTATAAINIAHYPGNAVSTLFGLVGSGAPFQTGLTAAPNDWALTIVYTGTGLTETQQYLNDNLAIDGSGNVFALSGTTGVVTKFSPQGVPLPFVTTYVPPAGGVTYNIAVDSFNNVWLPVGIPGGLNSQGGVVKLDDSGTLLSPQGGFSTGGIPLAVAFDSSDNAWVLNSGLDNYTNGTQSPAMLTKLTNAGADIFNNPFGPDTVPSSAENITVSAGGNVWVTNGALYGFNSAGTTLPGMPLTTGGINQPYQPVSDASGNIWVSDQARGSGLSKFTSAGAAVSSTGYTGGGMNDPQGIALDGAGDVWVANAAGIGYPAAIENNFSRFSEFSPSGVALSPATGYQLTSNSIHALAVDGSGSVWALSVTETGSPTFVITDVQTLTQTIGAAVPVVTPIAAGVKLGVFSSRP